MARRWSKERRDNKERSRGDSLVGHCGPLAPLELVSDPDVEGVGEPDGRALERGGEVEGEAELELELSDTGQGCLLHEQLFFGSEDCPEVPL